MKYIITSLALAVALLTAPLHAEPSRIAYHDGTHAVVDIISIDWRGITIRNGYSVSLIPRNALHPICRARAGIGDAQDRLQLQLHMNHLAADARVKALQAIEPAINAAAAQEAQARAIAAEKARKQAEELRRREVEAQEELSRAIWQIRDDRIIFGR